MSVWECPGCGLDVETGRHSVYCEECTEEVDRVTQELADADTNGEFRILYGLPPCPDCPHVAVSVRVRNLGRRVFWYCSGCGTEWTSEEMIEAQQMIAMVGNL